MKQRRENNENALLLGMDNKFQSEIGDEFAAAGLLCAGRLMSFSSVDNDCRPDHNSAV
jgi:hypothetical protein